jgi:ABC-type antimicrobial peptide transport system, ATPase component
VIADEPTGALDSKTSKEIMDIFTKLNEAGTTIIMVTHDSEVAEYACGQFIFVMVIFTTTKRV